LKHGRISRDEIGIVEIECKKGTEKKKVNAGHNKVDENIKNEMEKLLLIGLFTLQIQGILHITNKQFTEILELLEVERGLTKDRINSARKEREQNNKDSVYQMYLKGYSCMEMSERIPYSNEGYIKRIITGLIADRVITDREKKIATEARERRKGEKNNVDKNNERKPFEEKILGYFQIGFMSKEIQKMTGVSEGYVSKIKKKLIANGEITDKDIKENAANREPKAEKRRLAIGAMVNFTSDINHEVVNEHIAYVKAKIELGEMETSDMELISEVIPMERELMTLGNINFVIRYFTKANDLENAVDFINNCLESAHDYEDEKIKKLTEMRDTLQRKIEREKMSKRDRWLSEHAIRVSVQEKPKSGRGKMPKFPSKEEEINL
jgi:hypothetical protein